MKPLFPVVLVEVFGIRCFNVVILKCGIGGTDGEHIERGVGDTLFENIFQPSYQFRKSAFRCVNGKFKRTEIDGVPDAIGFRFIETDICGDPFGGGCVGNIHAADAGGITICD